MSLTVEDLVGSLKKQHILLNQALPGDVLITPHGIFKVSQIHNEPGHFVSVLDESGNGYVNVPGNTIAVILNRSCFGR